jgi:hypothetical protein
MPKDADEAWREVGRHVGDLGSRIHDHYRHQVEEREHPAGETAHGVADVLETLSRQVESAFEALGQAFHDQTVREEALRASRAFADAVEASVAGLGDEVKKASRRTSKRHDG